MTSDQTKVIINDIRKEVAKAIKGKPKVIDFVLTGIISNGHILFEDLPGLGKTLMISSFAQALGLTFKRIQFTPDLLPADVNGVSLFNMRSQEFELRKGPIFTNLLLADEINRATPKTQSALLEAMQEGTVSIDGVSHVLDKPFIVLATQNPLEYEGTFALPEAQLDRFLLKLNMGYPDRNAEIEVINSRLERKQEEITLEQVANNEDIIRLQKEYEDVHVSEPIIQYVINLVTETRNHPKIAVGASPRGSLGLIKAAKAWALVHGRDFVNPQDIQDVLIPVLSHRIIIRSGEFVSGNNAISILEQISHNVVAPRVE